MLIQAVERRRRETINEGINEIAKIVPHGEKNKGSILQAAVNYILQLKGAHDAKLENHTLEKVLLEQAVTSLSESNSTLQKEIHKSRLENDILSQRIQIFEKDRREDTK